MRLIEMTCKQCNAQLELNLDHMQAYCPYCGAKLLVDMEHMSDVLLEREKTNRQKTVREFDIQEKKLDFEQKQEEEKRNAKGMTIYLVVFSIIVALGWALLIHWHNDDKKAHEERVTELQQIEVQLDDAIRQHDYDEALLLANKLYLDDGFSDSETESWNEKRESYIEIIEKRQQ